MLALSQVVEQPLAGLRVRRDLGQPDRGLDRLDLAEERADAAERVVPPVLQQARGLGRDLPLAGIRQRAPVIDVAAHLVDDRRRVVLLFGRREALALVEDHLLLGDCRLALLRLRDRRDELGPAPALDDLLRRLAVVIEFPVPLGILVGRVQDRVVEEGIGHWLGTARNYCRSSAISAIKATECSSERILDSRTAPELSR